MSLISRVRKQTAVYWQRSSQGPDMQGQPRHELPVQIKCRWDDVMKEFVMADGSRQVSQAEVLPDRAMQPGDYLMRGVLPDVTNAASPKQNKGALVVRAVATTPNLRNTENLYTAYL